MSHIVENPADGKYLSNLPLALKALFTGYILVIGLGLLMAGGQILLTHGQADGKPGLSIDDIVYSYYGNRTGSTLENKLNGSMKANATVEERATMIKWARNGADETEWQNTIQPIVNQKCAACHSNMPTLTNIADFKIMQKIAEVDEGVEISSLTRVSHIHLFGIAFIFFFIGYIFSKAQGVHPYWKAALIFTPFAFLMIDIASLWLTKFDPNFAWLVIFGGFGYSLASTVMIVVSLYQMWVMDWIKARKTV